MTQRENYLEVVEFRGPRWMPCIIYPQPAAWQQYRDDLLAIAQRHPTTIITKEQRDGLKPRTGGVELGSIDYDDTGAEYRKVYGSYRAGDEYTDNWGCVWRNISAGIHGQAVGHPLAQGKALDNYQPPDPLTQTAYGPRDSWEHAAKVIRQAKQLHEVAIAPAYPDDSLFERLQYLRGFEDLMVDLLSSPPQLSRLIDMVVDYNVTLASKWTEIGADVVLFGDDLGTQTAAMMSPQTFRKWLKPAYTQMFQTCRRGGAHVHFHCDGKILELTDDLIDTGLSIINAMSTSNTIDGLRETMKGRVCLDLGMDRQQIFPKGSPAEVREHVKEAVMKLGAPAGGLMMRAEVNADIPLENVEAMANAMEEFREYYW